MHNGKPETHSRPQPCSWTHTGSPRHDEGGAKSHSSPRGCRSTFQALAMITTASPSALTQKQYEQCVCKKDGGCITLDYDCPYHRALAKERAFRDRNKRTYHGLSGEIEFEKGKCSNRSLREVDRCLLSGDESLKRLMKIEGFTSFPFSS